MLLFGPRLTIYRLDHGLSDFGHRLISTSDTFAFIAPTTFHNVFSFSIHHWPTNITYHKDFILVIPRCPVWKSFDFFFSDTYITTRSPYNKIQSQEEKVFLWFDFLFTAHVFFFSVINLSNLALNLFSEVTGNSFTVLHSIPVLNAAITVFFKETLSSEISLDNPSACPIS